jgi:glutamyl-tRNA synthetase
MTSKVKTRFAPSPTGMLHIGGARTALFNKLYARHEDGQFLVRIEDTDKERSTTEAVNAITEAMEWLGLTPDENYVYQSQQLEAHKHAVQELLASGYAYEVYRDGEDEVDVRNPLDKETAVHNGITEFAVRLDVGKICLDFDMQNVAWEDAVQGKIEYGIDNIGGDLVIARSDGTPTYNLAVVVDDHNMGITHVVRGDDHINNTPKQILIYTALGCEVPIFAHVPLIHGDDGKKLSKRHGAVSAIDFKELGYVPEAVCNYLLRLGWSYGDEEVISEEEAIKLFDIYNINKGSSTFNTKKLDWLNGQYLKTMPAEKLMPQLQPFLEKTNHNITTEGLQWIEKSLPELTQRAKRLTDLAESAVFYFKKVPLSMDNKAKEALQGDGAQYLKDSIALFEKEGNWKQEVLHDVIHHYCEDNGYKFGQVAQPLRAALTGTTNSPSVFHIMDVLGRDESLNRLKSSLH